LDFLRVIFYVFLGFFRCFPRGNHPGAQRGAGGVVFAKPGSSNTWLNQLKTFGHPLEQLTNYPGKIISHFFEISKYFLGGVKANPKNRVTSTST
jgi:hypothetical protein